jgi:alpha/beta superfamily hydrolase
MKRWFVLAVAASLSVGAANAQDYERERRWAAEVTPNIVVGDAVRLRLPAGREFLGLYAEGKKINPAILLVHGVGVHPDHGIIGALRASLADLGYATLSIQMPVQKSDATVDDYFPALFPEAAARIQAGADWLASKGAAHTVLLSHSMGSWMSNVYYERTPGAPFAAWICMGLTGGFWRMGNVKVPVLDVSGEKDLPQVLRADWRRRLTLDGIAGSAQVKIPGADHHYTGREKELTAAIQVFLAGLK